MHINTWEAVVVVSASLLNLVQNVGFLTWILPPDKINMHQYRSSKSFNVEDSLPPYKKDLSFLLQWSKASMRPGPAENLLRHQSDHLKTWIRLFIFKFNQIHYRKFNFINNFQPLPVAKKLMNPIIHWNLINP